MSEIIGARVIVEVGAKITAPQDIVNECGYILGDINQREYGTRAEARIEYRSQADVDIEAICEKKIELAESYYDLYLHPESETWSRVDEIAEELKDLLNAPAEGKENN